MSSDEHNHNHAHSHGNKKSGHHTEDENCNSHDCSKHADTTTHSHSHDMYQTPGSYSMRDPILKRKYESRAFGSQTLPFPPHNNLIKFNWFKFIFYSSRRDWGTCRKRENSFDASIVY